VSDAARLQALFELFATITHLLFALVRSADTRHKALIAFIGDNFLNPHSNFCAVCQMNDAVVIEGYSHEGYRHTTMGRGLFGWPDALLAGIPE
jgi:hypothetical protein